MLDQQTYDYVFSQCIRVCVDIMIPWGSSYLVGLRSHKPFENSWALPGGGVLFGETILEAAKRIAKKEVGADLESISPVDFLEFKEEIELCGRHSISIVVRGVLANGSTIRLPNHDSFSQISTCTAYILQEANMVPQHRKLLSEQLEIIH